MNNYFDTIVNNLYAYDVVILESLLNMEATEKHKAIRNKTLKSVVGNEISDAHYRNTILRLTATCLIESSNGMRDNLLHITSHGIQALEQKVNKEESA